MIPSIKLRTLSMRAHHDKAWGLIKQTKTLYKSEFSAMRQSIPKGVVYDNFKGTAPG